MSEQKLPGYTTPYKFTGKELDEETGLYYFGARYYDSRSSVWLSVDPLAGKYPNWNPYNYALNNPINFTDPNGMAPSGEGDYFSSKGEYLGNDNIDDKKILIVDDSMTGYVAPGFYNVDGSVNASFASNVSKNIAELDVASRINAAQGILNYYFEKIEFQLTVFSPV